MEFKHRPYDLHVLVCTNTRANGEKKSCGPQGADSIRAELKEWLKQELANSSIQESTNMKPTLKCRVNGSGCLDFCSKGVVIAIYPFGEFILNADMSNIEEIKSTIRQKLTSVMPADF